MKVSRFFVFLMVIFVIALLVYVLTTPSTKEIELTGIIMGNDYIASPLVQGRLQRLLVDEGSAVKKGQLIAEIDPQELQAARDSAAANIRTFEARLQQSDETRAMNDQQTSAAVQQAQAAATAARSQLEQAKTTLALNEVTYQRDEGLFRGGVLDGAGARQRAAGFSWFAGQREGAGGSGAGRRGSTGGRPGQPETGGGPAG